MVGRTRRIRSATQDEPCAHRVRETEDGKCTVGNCLGCSPDAPKLEMRREDELDDINPVRPLEGLDVLDVGCGGGLLCEASTCAFPTVAVLIYYRLLLDSAVERSA